MKPITNIKDFLERFDSFKDAEFRSVEVLSATSMKIVFATQDRARAFDWLCIELEFNGVSDARLLDAAKLAHIDMSDGITLIKEGDTIGFGISEYSNLSSLQDSISYIVAANIKYNEAPF